MSGLVLGLAITCVFLGIFIFAALALGFGRGEPDKGRLHRRLKGYSLERGQSGAPQGYPETTLGDHNLTRRSVDVADRLAQSRGFEESLANSLAAASLSLRPGEWIIIHLGSTLALGILFLLLSGLAPVAAMLGIGLGIALPYLFLAYRRAKRRSAFYAALPDMLQMTASSLSAGHSVSQAFDAVARGTDGPMADELGRAIAEARLGADLEDSLNGIAVRMNSQEMAWIVMAIRIQREVGGNLAEILNTVAETMRERERLRRQVKALSAEGRLSAVIIASLPFVFAIYMALVKPDYLAVLYSTPLGVLLLAFGAGSLAVGIFWLRKTVRVEV